MAIPFELIDDNNNVGIRLCHNIRILAKKCKLWYEIPFSVIC